MTKYLVLFVSFLGMARADFNLSANPSKFNLQKGSSVTVVVTQTTSSFIGILSYSLSVPDSQYSYRMTQTGNTATFVISAAATTNSSSAFFVVQATSGNLVHNLSLRATLTEPALQLSSSSTSISSVVPSPATPINFTALGTADWFDMGAYGAGCPALPCMPARKNSGTGLVGVSDFGTGDQWFYTYSPGLANVTWTDGASIPNGTAAHVNNNGILFQAFAATTVRTLTLVAGLTSGGSLTVSLHTTDGVTPDVVNTQTFSSSGVRVYTIPFSAATPGHQMVVTLTHSGGELLMYGAALAGTVTPETHYMTLTDDIQAFVLSAVAGDTLMLPDGYNWTGHLLLPARLATGYVDIKTNTAVATGTRIKPGEAKAVLTSPDESAVVQNDSSNADHSKRAARGYRFTAVEFTVKNTRSAINWALIYLGFGPDALATDIPSDITFDRCYIHGDGVTNYIRGIIGNANNFTVVNSYISGFVSTSYEANAINIYSSAGPINITNNYLEASGENIMFGGSGPDIGPSLIPKNGVVQRNYFSKPIAWRGTSFIVKNLLEFKNGYNFLIDSNVFENTWLAAQNGFGILVTPRVTAGVIANHVDTLTFSNNIIEHMGSGINIWLYDDMAVDAYGAPIPPSKLNWVHDITLNNNLFTDLSLKYSNLSHGVQIFGPPNNLVMTHNTFNFGETTNDHGWWLVANTGVTLSNAYIFQNDFGCDIYGDGRLGPNAVFNGGVFLGNNIRNATSGWRGSLYSATNTFNQAAAAGVGADVAGLTALEPLIKSGNR